MYNSKQIDLVGYQALISGSIVEHLRLGKQEWVTIQLPDNQKLTVNIKLCNQINADTNSQK